MSREATASQVRTLEDKSSLLRVFEEGARPREQHKIGLELEAIGVESATGRAIPFDGENGVEAILLLLSKRFGWEPVFNGDRTIGLLRGRSAITLEPGGQLELSSAPHRDLGSLGLELEQHQRELEEVSTPLGITWLAVGLEPVTKLEEVSWVPKSRYRIMKPYNARLGDRTLEMMALTASIQGNYDFESEADARKKVRVGSALGPIAAALMANSFYEGGQLNGYCCRRLHIWRNTDRSRTGVPDFFLDGSFSFERYAEWALDIPMYFILRNGEYVDSTDMTFRQFRQGGRKGVEPLESDWINHLTTLFPDVRLKDHFEVRTADSNPAPLAMALMAFWSGIFYDGAALSAAEDLVRSWKSEDVALATDDVAIRGLAADLRGTRVLQVARQILKIAEVGVSRLDREQGRHDVGLLDPLMEIAQRGISPAEQFRAKHSGDLKQLLQEMRLA